jgi:hypothetical protein
MDDFLTCVKCTTVLPKDKPETRRHVRCVFCGCSNPNPNFQPGDLIDNFQDESENPAKRRKRVIEVEPSTIYRVLSAGILSLAILLSYNAFFGNLRTLTYLYVAILLLLPTVRNSFVQGYWHRTLIRLSSRAQEHYTLESQADYTWLRIASTGYTFYFIYNSLFNYEYSHLRLIPSAVSMALSVFSVWLVTNCLEIAGDFIGKAFPKK